VPLHFVSFRKPVAVLLTERVFSKDLFKTSLFHSVANTLLQTDTLLQTGLVRALCKPCSLGAFKVINIQSSSSVDFLLKDEMFW
jgi:hypothetical protein